MAYAVTWTDKSHGELNRESDEDRPTTAVDAVRYNVVRQAVLDIVRSRVLGDPNSDTYTVDVDIEDTTPGTVAITIAVV